MATTLRTTFVLFSITMASDPNYFDLQAFSFDEPDPHLPTYQRHHVNHPNTAAPFCLSSSSSPFSTTDLIVQRGFADGIEPYHPYMCQVPPWTPDHSLDTHGCVDLKANRPVEKPTRRPYWETLYSNASFLRCHEEEEAEDEYDFYFNNPDRYIYSIRKRILRESPKFEDDVLKVEERVIRSHAYESDDTTACSSSGSRSSEASTISSVFERSVALSKSQGYSRVGRLEDRSLLLSDKRECCSKLLSMEREPQVFPFSLSEKPQFIHPSQG
ncbi:hypothetical protein B0H34DRAFT_795414 [Crassisporium funariophilum]|nr:hypothetical protein B0H34DRAFT_795414 [Crassisporium funariophilum]